MNKMREKIITTRDNSATARDNFVVVCISSVSLDEDDCRTPVLDICSRAKFFAASQKSFQEYSTLQS